MNDAGRPRWIACFTRRYLGCKRLIATDGSKMVIRVANRSSQSKAIRLTVLEAEWLICQLRESVAEAKKAGF